jgi:hypothetical protein
VIPSQCAKGVCVLQQNAELFTLTYGSIVRQLLVDHEDNLEAVNTQLEKM